MSSSVEPPRNSQARTRPRRTTVLATRPLLAYRTVDLVTATMLGVAFGVVFWAWNLIYRGASAPFEALLPPLTALLAGPWLLAGVVAGLVVRRPGAALLAEMVAAAVSALIGNEWGWTTVISGFCQGMGVEVALGIVAWRRFGPSTAILAGVLAAAFEVVFYEWRVYVADYSWDWKLVYLGAFALSGAVIAGLGGLALVRGLARVGAINAMPAGQEELERSAH